jgi:hypothetical protein
VPRSVCLEPIALIVRYLRRSFRYKLIFKITSESVQPDNIGGNIGQDAGRSVPYPAA